VTKTTASKEEHRSIDSDERLLVADIGGTNARFAISVYGEIGLSQLLSLPTRHYHGVIPAARAYLDQITGERPSRACMAVACPVWGDSVSLTNNDWSFSIENVRQSLNLKHLMVVNDFKALATGVSLLGVDDRMQIGVGEPVPDRPISVIGPGTGLGVASVVEDSGRRIVLDGEGGHVGFAPGTEREIEILKILSRRYGRVSVERILSGEGLTALYTALAEIDGIEAADLNAADIVKRAKSGSCKLCMNTINLFCSALGSFAGDTAMTMSSQGGVYIGGGIVPRMADLLINSPFRERFETKGRTSSYIKNVPTYLITTEYAALRGAASLLRGGFRARD